MKLSDDDLVIRLHERSDTANIVTMINRDPLHMLNGLTAEAFEQDLDEPGERIRDNTFVVELGQTNVGYFSLCFVERITHISVYCYGTVDVDWRRRGIGTAMLVTKRLRVSFTNFGERAFPKIFICYVHMKQGKRLASSALH